MKPRQIISAITLLVTVITLFLLIKKPEPVSHPQSPAAIAEHAQSFDQKMEQFAQDTQPSPSTTPVSVSDPQTPKVEVRLTSDEVGAVLAQSLGTSNAGVNLNSDAGNGVIKDEQVSFEGDVVHGQFLAEVAGKDVWITISGHLGAKDGYATFDPTEFKVGDLSVPVSMVNPTLQKKLDEQRDRLKLPDNVGSLRIENGELVLQQK